MVSVNNRLSLKGFTVAKTNPIMYGQKIYELFKGVIDI